MMEKWALKSSSNSTVAIRYVKKLKLSPLIASTNNSDGSTKSEMIYRSSKTLHILTKSVNRYIHFVELKIILWPYNFTFGT
jgi:hypothetical protein